MTGNSKREPSTMQDENCTNLLEKESLIQSLIEEISDKVLSLVPDNFQENLDSLEGKLTPILNRVRSSVTEKYFHSKDCDHHPCRNCGGKMYFKEKLSRKIVGLSTYNIGRRSFHCRDCDLYERPLDNTLNLRGRFSLEIRKSMLLLGQRIPFQEASDYLEKLLGVQVSDQSILSLVESVGRKVHQEDQQMVRGVLNKEGFIKKNSIDKAGKAGAAYLQMDGMMVQTREEGWKEIRNGILFSDKKKIEVDKHHNWITELTCFSIFNRNKNSLEAFKRRTSAESHNFGFEHYEKSVIIGDGAKWIWDYVDEHHPKAIQILDYFHACEYFGHALNSIEMDKRGKSRKIKELSQGKIKGIIKYLVKRKQTKEVVDCIRYFRNHQHRMNYKQYTDQGLDIGSGAIESTHRTLIQSRMKQAGMHWKKKNVQSIASVKSRYHSGRWDEMVNTHLKAA